MEGRLINCFFKNQFFREGASFTAAESFLSYRDKVIPHDTGGISFPLSLSPIYSLTKHRDYARQLPRWRENEKGDISGGNQQRARAIVHAIISILFPRMERVRAQKIFLEDDGRKRLAS